MELLGYLVDVFPTIGFPIICCGVLAWFVYRFYQDSTKQNQENMAAVQSRCQEREEKLYAQLEKQNEINGKFAAIIAQYEVKLDEIKSDVKEIKDIVISNH